ncbi:MAG: Ni/Fe hydrogenase, partial [Gammaproteobacteria bacterium]|nr:Ni/Fe hydrogenase [Gammaproteobacteria bacterium]
MGISTDPALIVFAWGNESRGDDGIGPILARRLRGLELPGLVVIEDHQLNIEHVMDFADGTPLLFIDASVAIKDGFS